MVFAMPLLTAAVLYFAIVFCIGFALGPIRVLLLEPALGATLAVMCEVPFLLAAMVLAARWVPRKVGLDTSVRALAAMGVGALVLQQLADGVVGIALRGLTPAQQFAAFATPAGMIYGGALIAFAAMPLLVNARS